MDIIDFRTSSYFSGTAKLVAAIFSPVALLIISISPIAGTIILAVCLLVFTTHYRINIDLNRRVCHDYVWILGFKNGERKQFDAIQYLFIKKNRQTQSISNRINSSTITQDVFDTYLKFSDDHKLHLFTDTNKDRTVKKLSGFASRLHVEIVDYTIGQEEVIPTS